MTLTHSWLILWCGLDRTEVFTVSYTGMQKWFTVHSWPEQSVLCTSWKTEL